MNSSSSVLLRGVSLILVAGAILAVITLAPALRPPVRFTLVADGRVMSGEVRSQSVRQALEEAGIALGDLDRVDPDLWEMVREGSVVIVTRVSQEERRVVEEIPFNRQVIPDEALPEGELKLVQGGVNGQEEIRYVLVYEDGAEVERRVIARRRLREAQDEIVLVGAQGTLASIPFSGTIVYLSHGNVWLMRHETGQKRPLTTSGDLDLRVFSLSPDGSQLLFAREQESGPLNTLWIVDTVVVGDPPQSLGIEGALWAEWVPDPSGLGTTRIAYGTGERTPAAPGWKAHNNLRLYSLEEGEDQELVAPGSGGLFGWWGTQFAWSPQGDRLAYANAGEVGIIDARSGARRALLSFPYYRTFSDWVWTPQLSWSPEGGFLAVSVHVPTEGSRPEESEAFELWVLAVEEGTALRVAEEVGMWAFPQWAPAPWGGEELLAFGRAQAPTHSRDSLYSLWLMDRDASNERRLYPAPGQASFAIEQLTPWIWSPSGDSLLLLSERNLHLIDIRSGLTQQITLDGGVVRARWAR